MFCSYTNSVVTLWNCLPELLLGELNYGQAVDMRGTGCIMAEFFTRYPIMQGSSEISQYMLISSLYGSITPEVWPNVVNLEVYKKIIPTSKIKYKKGKYNECFKLCVLDTN